MVKITIENLGQKEVLADDLSAPVLTILHRNRIDWLYSCGGKGRCTSCRMIVVDGMANLSSLTTAEVNYREMGGLGLNERLACQCRAVGDIIIRRPT